MGNCFDTYYQDTGRWPGEPRKENTMAFVEYSDTERSEKVWRTAPAWAIARENFRRKSNNEPELRCKGLLDSECSERQKAWNKEAAITDRIRLARAESLLLEVRAELDKEQNK